MLKVMSPHDWPGLDVEPAALVKVSSGGLRGHDLAQFIKRAGHAFADRLSRLELQPGEVPLHLIALGATELAGCNRNGDGFTSATCREKHATFVKHAHFYRSHQNKNPAKSYGVVKLSAFNEPMKRIELLVALNGTKEAAQRNGGLLADKELDVLHSGKDLPVSMACVLDPEYPVLTRDRGYVGIAQIVVGDLVWTHAGRWRRVTQLNRRPYTGEVFTFRVNGLPRPLTLTADHPMWAKVFTGSRETSALKDKARRYFQDPRHFDRSPARWHEARELGVGDRFFYRPLTRYSGYGQIADPALAAVMGYYLAEGSLQFNGKRAAATTFSCHMSDSLPRRLPRLVEALFPAVTVQIRPRAHSTPSLDVVVFSTEFSEFLRLHLGRCCRQKGIPPEIFNATRDIKLAFLGAWFDGDGWVDSKGGHWSTANYALALQGRDLLASLGIPASIYGIDHASCPTSGKENSGWEYTLNVAHLDLWQLAEVAEKVAQYPVPSASSRQRPAAMRRCPDGSYAYRISRVSSQFVSEAPTYNFEVEEDESYSLGGFVSHNCKIDFDKCSSCGNRARHRGEYCLGIDEGGNCPHGGCRHNLTKVASDGHQLHVDNPAEANICWFDISHVGTPADRTAYGARADYLEKAAAAQGGVLGGAGLAEALQLTLPVELLLDGEVSPGGRQRLKLAQSLAELERRDQLWPRAGILSLPDLSPLRPAGSPQMQAGLAALAREKVALNLRDFVRLAAGDEHQQLASLSDGAAQHLPGVYQRLLQDPQTIAYNPWQLTTTKAASAEQRRWAKSAAWELALTPICVIKQAHLQVFRGVNRLPLPTMDVLPAECEQLARHYALYKLAFLELRCENSAEFPLTAKLVCDHY